MKSFVLALFLSSTNAATAVGDPCTGAADTCGGDATFCCGVASKGEVTNASG